jgi:hypothetical protein
MTAISSFTLTSFAFFPSKKISPPSFNVMPSIAFNVVVLPAPFGPTKPQHIPCGTAKLTFFNSKPENFLRRFFISIAFIFKESFQFIL